MKELYEALFSGKMMTSPTWNKNEFIEVKNGQITNESGELVDITLMSDIEFVEYFNDTSNTGKLEKTLLVSTKKVLDGINGNTNGINKILDMLKDMKDTTTTITTEINQKSVDKEHAIESNDIAKLYYGVTGLDATLKLFASEYKASTTQKEVTDILVKFMPFPWMDNKALNTSVSYHGHIRSIIKEIDNNFTQYALDTFKLPSSIFEKINDENSTKAVNNKVNREEFNIKETEQMINNLKAKVKDIVKLGNKATLDDYRNTVGLIVKKQQTPKQIRGYYIGTYLALVTGRRISEILKTLEIKKSKGIWFFEGLLKKRGESSRVEAIVLDKDMDFIASALKLLRESLSDAKEMSLSDLNKNYNRIFNLAYRRITGSKDTMSKARDIYAELAFARFGENTDEETYKAKILGHKAPQTSATTHYMGVRGK